MVAFGTTENDDVKMLRVLVPYDSGFADGGSGFMDIILFICTPWTWWQRFDDYFIFPLEEKHKVARGEPPSGFFYKEFVPLLTVKELLLELELDGGYAREMPLVKKYYLTLIIDIPQSVITEIIQSAQAGNW